MSRIVTITSPGRGDTDLVLARFAGHLAAHGIKARGVVQVNSETTPNHPCDMDVRVLPDGQTLRISQNLGPAARGCRLDPSALESAVAAVENSMSEDVDVLIINKFGKHEAEGRGFRQVIATAIARDIPVVVGLNALNTAAFQDFAGGLAQPCAPDLDALIGWLSTESGHMIGGPGDRAVATA
ncbi:MAG: DUF2478 domain-containing protein [Pseudooceanicola sp.]